MYKNGENYLNFFKLTDTIIEGAEATKLENDELVSLINTKREEFLKKTSMAKFSKSIKMSNAIGDVDNKEILEFSSITAAVKYLKSKNVTADINLIAKCLNTGQPYKNYFFFS